MRAVGTEYPQPQVCAFSTGKNRVDILLSKVRTAMTSTTTSNIRTTVSRGATIIFSIAGETAEEVIVAAARRANDTITAGKSPIHKQIPPSTAMGAHISAEFSFTRVT